MFRQRPERLFRPQSPSSRRAWIEIPGDGFRCVDFAVALLVPPFPLFVVALLAEGVD